MKITTSILIILAVLIFSSCKITQKIPQYLETATEDNIDKQLVFPELKIQKNDLLAIQVYSDAIPKEAKPDELYNQPTPLGGIMNNSTNLQANTTTTGGYLVDAEGYITYPRLGHIKAEGLTKEQLGEAIKQKLTKPVELLKNPEVIIRFQSYKIVMLGELNQSQTLNIPTEKVNIFEAISMAGGVTEWGRKDRVQVIREQDGKREYGIVDLSSPEIFKSPYYYLKQNDIVLVDPIPEKAKLRDEGTTIARAGFAVSIVTAALVIFNLFRK